MPVRTVTTVSRRERAREHARRDILLAAARVFAERGYAAATLAELAEAAGFAAPSLYRYFQSKEELFRSLIDLLLAEFGATFDAPTDRGLPLGARLGGLFEAQARLADHHRNLLALLRLPDAAPALLDARRRLGGPHAGVTFYEERVSAWLRRNAGRGELRVPPEIAARALAGLAFSFLACTEAGAPPDGRARDLVDAVLFGIAAPAPEGGRRGASRP
jgi:AcrR family transcriptional regulator